jgi:glutaredoxin
MPSRIVLILLAIVFIMFFAFALTMTANYIKNGKTFFESLFPGMLPAEGFENGGAVKVDYYTLDGCPHCVAFNPEWAKFETDAKSSKSPVIQAKKYEARANREAVQAAGVEGFPTVMITKPGGATYTYEGSRTAKALMEEVKK